MNKHLLHGKIITDINRAPKELIERFKKHDTCKIGDAMGRYGIMHYKIKPIMRGMRVVGSAVTVLTKPGDALFIQKVIEVIQPGDVVVVDAGGLREMACIGERLLGYMVEKGLVGLVVDGSIRDSSGILELNIPVFSKGICISIGGAIGPGAINVPIQCGGVPIKPGDIVVGDDDGVVVVPQENAEEIADVADDVLKGELLRAEMMRSGKSVDEVYDLSPRIEIWQDKTLP